MQEWYHAGLTYEQWNKDSYLSYDKFCIAKYHQQQLYPEQEK